MTYAPGHEMVTEPVRWQMEVLEVVPRPDAGVVGYAMRGHPLDVAACSPLATPQEYVFLQVNENRFYRAGIAVLPALKNPAASLEGLLVDAQAVLDFPLVPEKRFCDPAMAREDALYCWYVCGETTFPWPPGGSMQQAVPSYQLCYQTNADSTVLTFTPGMGYTALHYQHHGSPCTVDLTLVEYFSP
ncbi:MAG: hypothetical protein D6770_07990 [Anaerolineae bacterium]|nr:MAG: hypothetical protein D6770_07990 [Anaerolineae bacterium]